MQSLSKSRNLAVLGYQSAGKTSLITQYVESSFVDSYYPTIERAYKKNVFYKNEDYDIEIIDTAGLDEFSAISIRQAVGIHGYMLVYSISSRSSFEKVQIIRRKILDFTGRDWIPMVLIGNKSDLHLHRQVSFSEGKSLAEQWNCSFVESSAKLNLNVDHAFEIILDQIELLDNPITEKKTRCSIL